MNDFWEYHIRTLYANCKLAIGTPHKYEGDCYHYCIDYMGMKYVCHFINYIGISTSAIFYDRQMVICGTPFTITIS